MRPAGLALTLGLVLVSGIVGGPLAAGAETAPTDPLLPFEQEGDAVPAALGGLEGDAVGGKAIVLDRRRGNCLICHVFPIDDEPFQGEIGPALIDVADRLDEGQIRLRLIDQSRLNPDTVMPPYYRVDGLTDVDLDYRGKPALEAQEIEDVIAYLSTLRGE